jgi:hypothetical protein
LEATLNRTVFDATVPCLTGCAIGEALASLSRLRSDGRLFWGSLALGLTVAFVAALPVNRWLIARGLGHAAVHAHHGERNQAG